MRWLLLNLMGLHIAQAAVMPSSLVLLEYLSARLETKKMLHGSRKFGVQVVDKKLFFEGRLSGGKLSFILKDRPHRPLIPSLSWSTESLLPSPSGH